MRFSRPLRTILTELSQSLNRSLIQQYLQPQSLYQERNQTPILFMHGFSSIKPINLIGYKLNFPFNTVNAVLGQLGYAVFTPSINAMDNAQNRAALWADHLQQILDKTGAKQVHIIAHGQGAIDARILACSRASSCNNAQGQPFEGKGLSHKIASITSIAGPHLGTPILDHLEAKEDKAKLNDVIDFLALINLCSIKTIKNAFENISSEYMLKEFNPCMKIPDSIPCFTISAQPTENHLDKHCLYESWGQLKETASFDGGGENDGLIPVNSAQFKGENTLLAGTQIRQWRHIGHVRADHFALTGYHGKGDFEYLPFYVGLAQFTNPIVSSSQTMELLTNGQWQHQPTPNEKTTTANDAKKSARKTPTRKKVTP